MFDPTKPVQTRDGRPARIICTDAIHKKELFKMWVLVTHENGDEMGYPYSMEGVFDGYNGGWDLINIPERKTKWQTVTSNNSWLFDRFSTKNLAIAAQTKAMNVIGHLRFDYEDDVIVRVEFEPC